MTQSKCLSNLRRGLHNFLCCALCAGLFLGVLAPATVCAGGTAHLLTAVDAIAGNQYSDQRPTLIIDGSGLTGEGTAALHDAHANAFTMWHTDANPGANAWVQVDFGSAFALDELWIWNMNQQNNTTRGLKNIKIEYTADGIVWNTLQPEEGITFADSPEGYPFQLAQATGQADMAATNLNDGSNTPIRFGGAKARYVKITAHPDAGVGSWGDIYFGLSEVRFTVQGSSPSVDQEAIDNVISLIGAIGEVAATAASESKIVAAETAYAALTAEEQALVTNYATLTAARSTYDNLMAQPADYTALNALIATVPTDFSVYTAASAEAFQTFYTGFQPDMSLTVADQATVDGYVSTLTAELSKLVLKNVEMEIGIAAGMVTPAAAEGKYDITWNANIAIGEDTTLDLINESATFINYGVYYATSEEEARKLISGNETQLARQIEFGNNNEAELMVYTAYGFRLKNVASDRVRTAIFYLTYECDGTQYTIYSLADTASTPAVVG